MKENEVALGFWTATSMVTGNMIGSGIFLLPASLAGFGGISIVGWLFSAVGSILPLVAVGALGLFFLEPAHFQPWNLSDQSSFSAVTATAALTLWAFLGLESANIPAAEVKDPEKNVPRAAVAGTLIAALVYIPGTVAVMGLVSPDVLAQSTAPFADAATLLWGRWGYYLIGIGAIVSCFGALNGWTLCLGRAGEFAGRRVFHLGNHGNRHGNHLLGRFSLDVRFAGTCLHEMAS